MKQNIDTSLLQQIKDGFLLVGICEGAPSAHGFRVIKETEKALQIECEDVEKKHRYPVWIPKSAISERKFDLPGIGKVITLFWSPWFRAKMDREKAWKRVALAMTCY